MFQLTNFPVKTTSTHTWEPEPLTAVTGEKKVPHHRGHEDFESSLRIIKYLQISLYNWSWCSALGLAAIIDRIQFKGRKLLIKARRRRRNSRPCSQITLKTMSL